MKRELKTKYGKNYNNKLNCDIFTTIRKYSPEKLKFHQETIGQTYENILSGKLFNRGKLLRARIANVDDLPDELVMVDTGLEDIKEAHNLLKNFGCGPRDMAILLTFKGNKNG